MSNKLTIIIWYGIILIVAKKKKMLIMSSIDELKGYILYMKTKKLSRGLTDKEYVKYDQLKRELAQREKEAKKDIKIKSLTA